MNENDFPTTDVNGERIDPATGLPLPDPFSDYIPCQACGEAEVEVWCYQSGGKCHNCGTWVVYKRPPFCGVAPYCKRAIQEDKLSDLPG